MLGEASHGTSEFYRARAAITKRLIEEHGFMIVAVEADWPDASAAVSSGCSASHVNVLVLNMALDRTTAR